jgi:hypothetical protein
MAQKGFSNYANDKILNHFFGKGAYTPPTIFVAPSTADPLGDGSGLAEPFGNNYSRAETEAADWNASSGGAGALDNAEDVVFPESSGAWGVLTHFSLFDQDRTSHAITGVNTGTKTFTVAGDQTLELVAGTKLAVDGSTGNDGMYTVVSATYTSSTAIVVSETISDATADGTLYPCGNLLGIGPLGTPKTVGNGDTPKFAAGDLDVTLARITY